MENSIRLEKSNKPAGFVASLLIHAAILLTFFFLYLTPPNPPITEMGSLGDGGVELNYGEEDAGTGDPNNLEPSSTETITEAAAAAPDEAENIITSDDPEAIVLKTDEKADKEVKKVEEVIKTETKPTTEPVKQVDNKFTLSKNTGKSGEDKGKDGDPGKKDGTVDGKALLGKAGKGGEGDGGPGGKGGFNVLGLTGWKLSTKPDPADRSDETGSIEYEIEVNDEGEIVKATPVKILGISPTNERLYRADVLKQVFDRIDNSNAPAISKGRFIYYKKAQ